MDDQLWFARDLEQWQRWQKRQGPALRRVVRWVKDRRGRDRSPEQFELIGDPERAAVLVAIDSLGPTQTAALLAPAKLLYDELPIAIIGPAGTARSFGSDSRRRITAEDLRAASWASLRHVLGVGHYLPLGALGYEISRRHGITFVVVQHGLLAPQVPPLPADATLLAFSAVDGDYWKSGRDDIAVRTVGSQLLWEASKQRAAPLDGPGIFLGQLHGAELPRADFAEAATMYCHSTGAHYRPHPSEMDLLSRRTHARWRRNGIEFDLERRPLAQARGPIASVFSTGVLEAAASGKPSWVVHPDPPRWLRSMWERYGMAPWQPHGDREPTPSFPLPSQEPAAAIASLITKGDLSAT
ncbi:hypothetical protein SAMN02910418_01677 [Bowdeniella nasicola]|uniref:RNA-binding protein n=1 Tax=Bowdeniella nasicola TaxID=208480 RepID=A0A1H4BJ28_9ACTO|nr:hypothetical protein SAMN02910418_01677 [Bowdeniella nasicola]